MIAKYKLQDKEDLINYFNFCDNIDRVFGEGVSPTEVIGGSKSSAVRKTQKFNDHFLIEFHRGGDAGHGCGPH